MAPFSELLPRLPFKTRSRHQTDEVDGIRGEYVELGSLHSFPGTSSSSEKKQRQLRGWRVVALTSTITAGFVLLLNLLLVIIGTAKSKEPVSDGIVTLFEGDCGKMTRLSTVSHVIINILSSALLASSSACMQCLTAPTRAEIDKAHASGRWMDVGVSSVRNLRFISNKRRLMWLLLLLSSLPLHLMYNSVIFPETSANEYVAALVAENFGKSGNWTSKESTPILKDLEAKYADLVVLSNEECIKTYNAPFVSNYRSVLAVGKIVNETNSVLTVFENSPGSDSQTGSGTDYAVWMCPTSCFNETDSYTNTTELYCDNYDCDIDQLLSQPSQWQLSNANNVKYGTPTNVTVDHCLAEEITPHCQLDLSQSLLIVVIIANGFKLACFWFLFKWRAFQPLVTVGDAIASFMVHPDQTTKGFGPLSAVDVRKGLWGFTWKGKKQVAYMRLNYQKSGWRPHRYRWFRAASWRRWSFTAFCCLSLEGIAIFLIFLGFQGAQYSTITQAYEAGLGAIVSSNIITFTEDWTVTQVVLLANLPQLLVSFMYVFYNGLFTAMLLAQEYARFGTHRKRLRVSAPRAKQRSTLWLQIPFRYGVPMLCTFIVLHYFISQSVYLAKVNVYTATGQSVGSARVQGAVNGAGYSPIGMFYTIILGAVIIATLFGLAFLRRYSNTIPIVSSCSAAISAACHKSKDEDEYAVLKPIKYGRLENDFGEHGYPRVSFTSQEVRPLVKGEVYD